MFTFQTRFLMEQDIFINLVTVSTINIALSKIKNCQQGYSAKYFPQWKFGLFNNEYEIHWPPKELCSYFSEYLLLWEFYICSCGLFLRHTLIYPSATFGDFHSPNLFKPTKAITIIIFCTRSKRVLLTTWR